MPSTNVLSTDSDDIPLALLMAKVAFIVNLYEFLLSAYMGNGGERLTVGDITAGLPCGCATCGMRVYQQVLTRTVTSSILGPAPEGPEGNLEFCPSWVCLACRNNREMCLGSLPEQTPPEQEVPGHETIISLMISFFFPEHE